ncbi:MAG TPA: enoyl-CoA hydratase-related protein, partial [Burkholderiales bacterium]|nr:enoyl-CoA hydratase-related protein [Burkholderiales bacterium]
TKLGLIPGVGGTQTLPRAAGERRAKELILTGQAFDAQQGYEWGVVNRVCDNVVEEALATARAIADNGPLAVRQAKKAVRYGLQMDLATGIRFSIEAYNQLVGTEDRREGVRAFNEKRKPRFQGK